MRGILIVLVSLIAVGCSNTWHGVKEDTYNAGEWTKHKVHNGAAYIERITR